MLATLVAVVLAMAGGAAASPEQVMSLLEAEKYSEALREGKTAVEGAPSSAEAHHAYGVVLHSVFRRGEAARQLERAHQLAPDDAAIAVDLGWVLAETGKLDRARALAAGAKGGGAAADALIAWLDRDAKLRAEPKTPPPPGGASAYVAQVMEKLARGEIDGFLRDDIDRAVLDRWVREVGGSSGSADEFIAGMTKGIREAASARGAGFSLRGHEIGGESAREGGPTVVTVAMLVESRATDQQIAMFERAVVDPSLPVPMDPTLAKVLRGLEPADRKATLGALAQHSTVSEVQLEFEVTRGAAGGWKVVDVREPDSGLRLSQVAGMTRDLADRGLVDVPKRRNRAYEIGQSVGRLLGSLLVLALFVALWRRHRRRKG
jgi:hypothetical protein